MRLVAFLASVMGVGALIPQHNSTCGLEDTGVVDCENPDLGTCGNACCAVNITGIESESTTDVYDKLVAYLKSGGTDGSFDYVTGPDAHGHNPSDDLRQYNISWDFILQGTHTTYPGYYVDTLDFAIYHDADENKNQHSNAKTFSLRAFNLAGVHGALGDHGQSYKSIAYLAKDAFGHGVELHKIFGCGIVEQQ